MDFLLALDTKPLEAKTVDSLPVGPDWQYEPKWDGFRCLAFKANGAVELRAKSGKSLSRYFPEMIIALKQAEVDNFVVDGELTIPKEGSLSFSALQDRIHPAESRVRKLASETPSRLILFDCLAGKNVGSLLGCSLLKRRDTLEGLMGGFATGSSVRLSPYTRDRNEAVKWLEQSHGALDGIVAKRLSAPYGAGKREMLKVKTHRSADCVVGGFRYVKDTKLVGSLLLGLYNAEGKLDHVGYTSAISDAVRPSLTEQLEALAGGSGFTGDAPGGPSRWATDRSTNWQPLHPELVVEVSYDQVTDGRFRHGTMLLRWRPDKSPSQCTREQVGEELSPGKFIEAVLERPKTPGAMPPK